MREISPATGITAEEFFEYLDLRARKIVTKIRDEKIKGLRPLPSEKLIDCSTVLNSDFRKKLLNKVAILVDENLVGRSEMCIQFASLMSLSLTSIGIQSRGVFGKAHYYKNGREVFVWEHAWVEIGEEEIIDGNVDSLYENPTFPSSIVVSPYWGIINQVPKDRKLVGNSEIYAQDEDVNNIWWPELQRWLINNI